MKPLAHALTLPKDIYKNAHSNTIYNSPQMETTQMTINSRVDM